MSYSVNLKPRAERDLDKLPIQIARRVWQKLLNLELEPRPLGCIKLEGEPDAYRIRIGDYRVIYLIDDSQKTVEVIRIAHRREIYR
jgi:mRNA interferase RelE/StbE